MKYRPAAMMFACLCAVAATPAIAARQSGYVKDLYVRDSDGLIFVDLFGAVDFGNPHPCGTRSSWIVPDEKTESGKRLFSTLLAALVAGHRITIQGKNTCTRSSEGEDIQSVEVR